MPYFTAFYGVIGLESQVKLKNTHFFDNRRENGGFLLTFPQIFSIIST